MSTQNFVKTYTAGSGNFAYINSDNNQFIEPEGTSGSPIEWGVDNDVNDTRHACILFTGVTVPNNGTAGVTINSVTFRGFSVSTARDQTTGDFHFEDVDNADMPTTYNELNDLVGNSDNYTTALTTLSPGWAGVELSPEDVNVGGAAIEIFDRGGWTSGNDMLLLIREGSMGTPEAPANEVSSMRIASEAPATGLFQLTVDWDEPLVTSSINNNMPLYISGENASGTIPLYAKSPTPDSGTIPLYTKSPIPDSGTAPLFIPSPVAHMPLFTPDPVDLENENADLYVYGVNNGDSDVNSTTLNISGGQFLTAPTYISGPDFETSVESPNLYISGSTTPFFTEETLYISGGPPTSQNPLSDTNVAPLFIRNEEIASNNIPLHIENSINFGKTTELYTVASIGNGSGLTASNDFFLRGAYLANNNISTFMAGHPSNDMPLFIGKDPIADNVGINLYVNGWPGGGQPDFQGYSPLFIGGILNNGQAYNDNSSLFLEGPLVQNSLQVATLNIEGFVFSDNQEIVIYTEGSNPTSENPYSYNDGTSLFIRNEEITTENITLHVGTDFNFGSNTSLYVNSSIGSGNIPLYLSGVYSITDSINLTIPRPIDNSTIGTATLHHRGFLE